MALQPSEYLAEALRASKGGRLRLHGWPWPCSTAPSAHTLTWPSASPHLAQPREPPQAATQPSQPPGSLASTLLTTPDPAQPISSRAAARPASIQRHRPWPGRCARTLRSSSFPLRSKGGRLRDAVTPPPALLLAKEVWVWALVHRHLGGLGPRLNRAGPSGHVGGRVPPQQSTAKAES